MAIPKKIHQVWIGAKMPKEYIDWTSKMERMNPEWEHKLWRNEILERYADDPYVAFMVSTNERSAFLVDRIRVLLLRDEGGLYADADCFPVRPLKTLDVVWNDPRIEFVAGMRNPDRRHVSLNAPGVAFVDNTVMASSKGGEMAKRLCNLYQPNSRKHIGLSMGREILRSAEPSTCLLSYHYFYAEQDNPKAVVLHDDRNAFSWSQPNKEAYAIR